MKVFASEDAAQQWIAESDPEGVAFAYDDTDPVFGSAASSLKRRGLKGHMLAWNIHPKIVQERLLHSSIAITMDIYSHLMPNMQEEAAAAVDGVLWAAINKRTDDVIGAVRQVIECR